ncbi:diguanylate cyclase [Jeongeupia wiesaeckerbachi]|uniref:sensor domain-containing diguanylate cyclase n=1 Tax=Jeongeupia wiesaeckerbachi TaxID=3051218 RepID=UPI003D807A2F
MLTRLKRRIQAQPIGFGCAVFTLLAVCWLPLAWYLARSVVNEEAERYVVLVKARRASELNRVTDNLRGRFDYLKAAPEIIAHTGEIRRALQQPSRDAIDTGNRYLQMYVARSLADTLWVLDRSGKVLMGSDAGQPDNLIGTHLPQRQYFVDAIGGLPGMQFSYGTRTGIPGFFFSAPIMADGMVLGVVVLKVKASTLDKVIDDSDLLISDVFGVSVLARHEALRMRALPGAAALSLSAEMLQHLYHRNAVQALRLVPTQKPLPQGLFFLDGGATPYLFLTNHDPQLNGLRVHMLVPIRSLEALPAQQRFYFGLIGGCGLLFGAFGLLVAIYLLRTRGLSRQLALANRELRQQADTDFLTGCANRRKFDRRFASELARSLRYGSPLTLALIDIDHFKRINDVHGHPVGDAALIQLVDLIQQGIRETDQLGRLGGEEFGLLLPQTEIDGVLALLERLRKQVEQQVLPVAGGEIVVTISIGYAAVRPGDDVARLRARADAALYAAKQGGRNRVCREANDIIAPDEI